MSEDILHLNDIIGKTFDRFQLEKMENAGRVVGVWEKVLLRIRAGNPNEGRNLVDHSRIIDLKNGVLLVEADHPGWIELLQLHKKFILTGIQKEEPGLGVSAMAFRLKGRRGELFDPGKGAASVQEAKKEMERRAEREEAALGQAAVSRNSRDEGKKEEFPPELAAILEDLRKSMLTNSKK